MQRILCPSRRGGGSSRELRSDIVGAVSVSHKLLDFPFTDIVCVTLSCRSALESININSLTGSHEKRQLAWWSLVAYNSLRTACSHVDVQPQDIPSRPYR